MQRKESSDETVPIEKNTGRAKITNEELISVIAEEKIAAKHKTTLLCVLLHSK